MLIDLVWVVQPAQGGPNVTPAFKECPRRGKTYVYLMDVDESVIEPNSLLYNIYFSSRNIALSLRNSRLSKILEILVFLKYVRADTG